MTDDTNLELENFKSFYDSESIENEEELKMFQKVLCTYDIDNKSEGLLYCPKPPESSFYNEDYYLDESLLNNLLV